MQIIASTAEEQKFQMSPHVSFFVSFHFPPNLAAVQGDTVKTKP